MTPPPSFLPIAAEIILARAPTHFRAWRDHRPYNLCDAPLGATKWSPYRSIVTCPSCLERLR